MPISPSTSAPERESLPAPPEQVAFEVKDLSVWYGKKQALNEVSLSVPAKKITAIIGPSGCGKSTFLRCLNRMHELVPQARMDGTIRFFGENLYAPRIDPTVIRRRIGMVFQKSNPFPTMSIQENVTVGLRLNGVRDRAFLGERTETPGLSLSGGQQQRLCIARAIATEPEVLLMDEPASALDPLATSKIEDLIHELCKDYTIIIVTHNMQQASRVSDMTAFFYLGKLIEFDTTTRVFTAPREKQTEDYVTGRFG